MNASTTPSGLRAIDLTDVSRRWGDVRSMVVIAAQLSVLMLVIQALNIENPVFHDRVIPLAFGGAVVHHFLPKAWRAWCFVALSITGFALVFGVTQVAWFLVLAAAMLAWLHLPIAFGLRFAGWVAMVAVLGFARAGTIPVPWSGALWPVFGSIFMLRAIVYVYELRYQKGPVDWKMTLSWFFMLPSVSFPFFPIVDFGMFRRTYYDKPAFAIYQTGVHWMVRGLTHLVLYRLVYQHLTLGTGEVDTGRELVQYLLANFALYLRVSGQFHLIVGLLHLFGFRLPETHRFFYLAASFPDFWRRINIYWKDFMQKVFFMPVYMPLVKKHGDTVALVVATAVTIFATWFLHSYQWFWLLGRWLFTVTDVLFWVILGVLLVAGSLRERKRGRVRPGTAETRTLRHQVRLGVQAIGVFTIMCVIWAFWNSPTLGDALALFAIKSWDWTATAMVLVTWMLVGVGAGVGERIRPPGHEDVVPPTAWGTLRTAAPLLAVWGMGFGVVNERLHGDVRGVLRDLQVAALNRRDANELQRGYYEELTGVNRFNGELWNVYVAKGNDWPRLQELGGTQSTRDLLRVQLKPYLGIMFHGHPFRTNRFGMRDGDYAQLPAPGTHRVAVLGSSYVMGDGVADGHTFEALVESRLNRERPVAGPVGWEFLNFGVAEYSPISNLMIMDNGRVSGFEPDVVLLVGHVIDMFTSHHVIEAVQRGWDLKYDYLRHIVDSVGARQGMSREELKNRLLPMEERLARESFQHIARVARERKLRLIWVLIPTPMQRPSPEREALLRSVMADVGIERIDMSDVYRGHDERALVVADFDRHPNTLGHRLIADRLYKELLARPHLLGGSPDTPATPATSAARP
ncbi:MAG: hypothetical protein IT361_01205 [Gemmatimonadaceae bacterium]|nr:hypothetical protein [Gemmatimonadaceae bacterium]